MRTRENFAFLKSLIALALIVLCFIAAQWQYNRGVDRHQRNFLIEENIAAPKISLENAAGDLTKNEWRTVTTQGVFDASQTILLRNRYFEGLFDNMYLFYLIVIPLKILPFCFTCPDFQNLYLKSVKRKMTRI